MILNVTELNRIASEPVSAHNMEIGKQFWHYELNKVKVA